MKKIIFSLIFLSSFIFAEVKDGGKVFNSEEVKALNDRINLLKEQTGTNFDVVTLAVDDDKIFDELEKTPKKIIIVLQKGEDNSIKVKMAFSNDINLNGYEDKINKKLDELERVISPKTFSDYTLELLAETGDILVSIQLDAQSAAEVKEGLDKRSIIIFVLKSFAYIVFIILGYIIYMYINRKRILTYCRTCNKHMQVEEEIKTQKEHIKIYACPSCGRLRRVIYKKRR